MQSLIEAINHVRESLRFPGRREMRYSDGTVETDVDWKRTLAHKVRQWRKLAGE
jgi:hypothetical protein